MRSLMFGTSIGVVVLAGLVLPAAVHDTEAQEFPDFGEMCDPGPAFEFLAENLTIQAACGGELTAEQAAGLERRLEEAPADLKARARLLGYLDRRYEDAAAQRKRLELALWFIRNEPGLEFTGSSFAEIIRPYAEDAWLTARQLWLAHLEAHPDDPAILRNAAGFFTMDEREMSAELLERGARLEPTNPHWPRERGHLAELGEIGDDGRDPERAREALAHYERAWELSDLSGRDNLLEQLAWAALDAGEDGKAREYAEAMLVEYPDEGNLEAHTHNGNIVLGRLALADGDIEEAKARLLAAAETDASPVLASFGPEFGLAKELLELGESETVLGYLRRCGEFWEMGAEPLAEWIRAIEAGETPDFGRYARR